MLVGNKCDLKHLRAVLAEDAKKYANDAGLSFIEASALDATNVEEAFTQTITKVHEVQLAKIRKELDMPGQNSGTSEGKGKVVEVNEASQAGERNCCVLFWECGHLSQNSGELLKCLVFFFCIKVGNWFQHKATI